MWQRRHPTLHASCQWDTACKGQICLARFPDLRKLRHPNRFCDPDTGILSAWSACRWGGCLQPHRGTELRHEQHADVFGAMRLGHLRVRDRLPNLRRRLRQRTDRRPKLWLVRNVCLPGSTCSGGTCTCATSSCATAVATGIKPYGIAVSGANVFVSNHSGGAIVRAPISGGAPVNVVTGQSFGSVATDIAVGGGYVFWSTGGTLRQAAEDGSGITSLANAEVTTISMVSSDGVNAYYMTNYNIVKRVPVGGGTAVQISAGPFNSNIQDMVLNGGTLYWTNDGIYTADYSSKMPNSANINKAATTATIRTAIVSSLNFPQYQIATDGTYVFWNDGSLHRVGVAGGTP